MEIIFRVLIGLIALIHLYFLWLKMFAWTSRAPKIFKKFPQIFFEQSQSLAGNQGLYNGFLAAGLVWSFFIKDYHWQNNVFLFFLICISVAGIYGSFTAEKKMFYFQASPALAAIVLILAKRYL